MRNRLYLGAMSSFLAGVILAVVAAGGAHPLVIGLTAGACACFVATALLPLHKGRGRGGWEGV